MKSSGGNNIPQPNPEVTKLENAMVKGDLASALDVEGRCGQRGS